MGVRKLHYIRAILERFLGYPFWRKVVFGSEPLSIEHRRFSLKYKYSLLIPIDAILVPEGKTTARKTSCGILNPPRGITNMV